MRETREQRGVTVRTNGRQGISTKFLGPTTCRGARVKATAQGGSIVVPWDYKMDQGENHAAAAKGLVDMLGWGGNWIGSGSPDGSGYMFVEAPQ